MRVIATRAIAVPLQRSPCIRKVREDIGKATDDLRGANR